VTAAIVEANRGQCVSVRSREGTIFAGPSVYTIASSLITSAVIVAVVGTRSFDAAIRTAKPNVTLADGVNTLSSVRAIAGTSLTTRSTCVGSTTFAKAIRTSTVIRTIVWTSLRGVGTINSGKSVKTRTFSAKAHALSRAILWTIKPRCGTIGTRKFVTAYTRRIDTIAVAAAVIRTLGCILECDKLGVGKVAFNTSAVPVGVTDAISWNVRPYRT